MLFKSAHLVECLYARSKKKHEEVTKMTTKQMMVMGLAALCAMALAGEASERPATDDRGLTVVEKNRNKDSITDIELVHVPGGCFTANGKQTCLDSFLIGKYEVTQGQFEHITGTNPSRFNSCGDDCPVEQVSWEEAQSFISRLNSLTGKRFRLPTEAEWEYSCRSGGKSEEYCGGNNIDAVAWHDGNSGYKTHPVGQKQANGLGIYDMSGNVWEWVSDWYGSSYPSSGNNPQGPSSGFARVARGGGWGGDPAFLRSSGRYFKSPVDRYSYMGFRLAASSKSGKFSAGKSLKDL
jgi:sulfatase modifying factor 1